MAWFRHVPVGRPSAPSRLPGGPDQDVPVPHVTPVVLEARPGAPQAPPVRIYLGTQPEQYRAERVFFYSLLQVRDPDRRYEIYRMVDLPGFDRRGWRTGFTNYRFAIPDLAGRRGRAIYNDVDQIYLGDPAALFDQSMDGHGYLALLPQDTAVMLIDCERMVRCWTYAKACRRGKKALCAEAAAEPGRWGALDPVWHARDLEYRHGQSRLLHYTTLHLQPWRPTPDRYSYHIHPYAEYFHGLEQAADAEGYEVFTADRPSPGFAAACRGATNDDPAMLADETCRQALELGASRLTLVGPWRATPGVARWPWQALRRDDLPRQHAIAATGLERLPTEDIPWLLERLFRLARHWVLIRVSSGAEGSPVGSPEAWRALLRRVARRYPEHCWQLDCLDRAGRLHRYRADPARRITPPRVWALRGVHPGDNAQLREVTTALGWPHEMKRLRSCLHKPADGWPDLLLSVGWLPSLVARAIRWRAGRRPRLVVLGRPFAPLSRFDRVITTPQYDLPLRENVVDLPAPFAVVRTPDGAQLETWRQRLAYLPRPWIVLLVGGDSKPYRFDTDTAAALGRAASAAVRPLAGSLLISTSPRTGGKAADALLGAIDVPRWCYRYGCGGDNPYPALLALGDAFIVTAESVSMLTEACMTGRPVTLFPLPARRSPLAWLRHGVERRVAAIGRKASMRGTPLQQTVFGRLRDKAIEIGLYNGERRIGQVHLALGVHPLSEGLEQLPGLSPALLAGARERALRAIREVLEVEASPAPAISAKRHTAPNAGASAAADEGASAP